MNPGLMHSNPVDYVYSLIVDVFIFLIKSIYFFAETVFLTITPYSLRSKKVSTRVGNQAELQWKKRKFFLLVLAKKEIFRRKQLDLRILSVITQFPLWMINYFIIKSMMNIYSRVDVDSFKVNTS